MNIHQQNQSKKHYHILLIIGIVIIAFNLRPALTSVGPVIGSIRDSVGLSNWSAGILTSLPLIAFAIVSPLAPRLGHRITNEWALVVGMILLAVGIGIRSIPVVFLLFFGTLLIGIGIAVLNVLLPGVIKEKYPEKVGVMTGVYSTSMGLMAATASGLTVPLTNRSGLGWEFALIVWALPALIGITIWVIISKKNDSNNQVEMRYVQPEEGNKMWRSPLAWQVALFMGFQSFIFYVTISWLPEILQDYGVTMSTAGWMLSLMQFIGLPMSFLAPMIAGKIRSQSILALVMASLSVIGYSGLLFGTSKTVMVISTILIGFKLGGVFPLALTLLGMRVRTARQAAQLSGMAQSLGYLLAAIGPMLIGFLFDITQSWKVPIITLMGIGLIVMTFGVAAGRDRYVLENEGIKGH